MSCATSHIWDCARWSPSCLILPRQPFFQPLDRIIAVLEFRIAQQLLVQRNGSLHPLDHIFLQRAPEAHQAALARTAIDDQLANHAVIIRRHPVTLVKARIHADMHAAGNVIARDGAWRSEEHTSELQSLMRISYAVFCLKKKTLRQTRATNRKN